MKEKDIRRVIMGFYTVSGLLGEMNMKKRTHYQSFRQVNIPSSTWRGNKGE